jgi:hypothetical protein
MQNMKPEVIGPMTKVLVKKGDWNNQVIKDKTFSLFRGLSIGSKGPFITVNGQGVEGFPQRNFRVGIDDPSHFELNDPNADIFAPRARRHFEGSPDPRLQKFIGAGDVMEVLAHPAKADETDDEIRERLIERFSILQDLTSDLARGHIKGLVVWGASGVGKSHEVEAALNRDSLMDKLSFDPTAPGQDTRRIGKQGAFKPRYNVVKGYSTPSALYMTLYEYSESKETLVFDDCDAVLGDETSLNLLKAALDTTGRRMISWKSSSRNGTDAPDQFEFKGSVVFITNVNFEKIVERGTAKMAPHLEAIMSRCLCLDLTIDTVREKLVRIDHVCRDLRMLELQHGLPPEQVEEVLAWTHKHARRFRELSLRKVGQLASLRAGNDNWQRVAEVTILKQSHSGR